MRIDRREKAQSTSLPASLIHEQAGKRVGRSAVFTRSQRIVKRAFDLIFAFCALILLFPLFVLIAIAIKLDSPGPIIFCQKRVGQFERHFTMYKFRSMFAENSSGLRAEMSLKQAGDPRVTRVGKLLRRTSLDELPQFFNVLIGDMSVVGPRPEVLWIAERHDPWQRERTTVPQGITGWWQVTHRATNPSRIDIEYDLYYIRHYSLWLDMRILLMTLRCVVTGKGAI